ncbi:MAG: hypothetical protein LBV16_06400, partial [Elusimicrobiota bacterium]|nr:hypothetical protein [Elusimicrobiota bacterium]
MLPIKSTIKQILKTISKSVSASVSVGADPCVCHPKINLPSTHKSPTPSFPTASLTPSFPSVPVGNPFSKQNMSLFLLIKTISKSVSVGADPCVCPPKINLPSTHKSPTPSFPIASLTPSFPSVSIGNPFSSQSASLHSFLPFVSNCFRRLSSLSFKNSLFHKIKSKLLLTMLVLMFSSI